MDARISRRQKRISKKQEDQTALEVGGRTQANSGATRMGGGADVRGALDTRIECKYTEKTQYVLKFSELEKLRLQAIKTLEVPVFQIAFRWMGSFTHKYAVIKWDAYRTGGKCELPQTWSNKVSKSCPIDKDLANAKLCNGRVQIALQGTDRAYLFELMHWEDYLQSREEK